MQYFLPKPANDFQTESDIDFRSESDRNVPSLTMILWSESALNFEVGT